MSTKLLIDLHRFLADPDSHGSPEDRRNYLDRIETALGRGHVSCPECRKHDTGYYPTRILAGTLKCPDCGEPLATAEAIKPPEGSKAAKAVGSAHTAAALVAFMNDGAFSSLYDRVGDYYGGITGLLAFMAEIAVTIEERFDWDEGAEDWLSVVEAATVGLSRLYEHITPREFVDSMFFDVSNPKPIAYTT